MFKRKTQVDIIPSVTSLKSYRFLGEEAEALGQRLDYARASLAKFKTRSKSDSWGRNYWQAVIDQLIVQWRALPVLHDADAQMSIIPRWTVDYNYYEIDDSIGQGDITDRLFNKVFREPNLNASWEREVERQLVRARSVL